MFQKESLAHVQELERGAFWQKSVSKETLLTGWKFQLNISGDSEVVEKFCQNSFNPAKPSPNTLEGLKLWDIVKYNLK